MWWNKPNPNRPPAGETKPFPFMKLRVLGFLVSLTVITLTTFSLATQGLKLGLDFTGGVQVEAAREAAFDSAEVRRQVAGLGFEESNVTTADGGNTVIIRVCVITCNLKPGCFDPCANTIHQEILQPNVQTWLNCPQ